MTGLKLSNLHRSGKLTFPSSLPLFLPLPDKIDSIHPKYHCEINLAPSTSDILTPPSRPPSLPPSLPPCR